MSALSILHTMIKTYLVVRSHVQDLRELDSRVNLLLPAQLEIVLEPVELQVEDRRQLGQTTRPGGVLLGLAVVAVVLLLPRHHLQPGEGLQTLVQRLAVLQGQVQLVELAAPH